MDSMELNNILIIKNRDKYKCKTYIIYTLILLITIIIFLIYSCYTYVNIYYFNKGLVINNNNIIILTNTEDISKVVNSNNLIINNHKYSYIIKEIQDEITVDNDYNQYKKIDIKLNYKKLIKNDVVNIKIKYKKVKLINYIFKFIFGKE